MKNFHFHTNKWWTFPGVSVTARLLESPELFSVFLSISAMPLRTVFCAPVTIVIIVLRFFNSQATSKFFLIFSFSHMLLAGTAEYTRWQVLFSLFINFRSGLNDPIVSQSLSEFQVSHFPGYTLVYIYTVWLYVQMLIPSEWITPNRVKSFTSFALVYCIYISCDQLLHLCLFIIYIHYSTEYYQFFCFDIIGHHGITILKEIQHFS